MLSVISLLSLMILEVWSFIATIVVVIIVVIVFVAVICLVGGNDDDSDGTVILFEYSCAPCNRHGLWNL